MKPILTLVLAVLAAFALPGCKTFDSRAKEKAAAFNPLSAEKKAALKQGTIEVGDSEDLVYVALGSPDETRVRKTAKEATTTWVYLSYSETYEGYRHIGYRRKVFYNPETGRYGVALIPVEAEVVSQTTEEALRVEFKDGKVTAIEEAKS